MSASLNKILQDSTGLSTSEKAQLALAMINSIDSGDTDSDYDAAWHAELERRDQALRENTAKMLDWADVKKEIIEG